MLRKHGRGYFANRLRDAHDGLIGLQQHRMVQQHRACGGAASIWQVTNDATTLITPAGKAVEALVHGHAFGLNGRDEPPSEPLELWRITGVDIAGQEPRQLIKRRYIFSSCWHMQ